MTDRFSYVSVLLSMVIALALTHLLAGVASMIRARVTRYSRTHIAWIGILLFSCVDFWFSMWGLRASEDWSLLFVLYLLALATLLFVSCHLAIPDLPAGEDIDLVAVDQVGRRRYLPAYFCYMALAVVANLTIEGFATAVLINLAMLVLIAIAWKSSDARAQGWTVVLMILLTAYYAATYIPAL